MQEATEKTVLGNFDNATFRYYGITSTFFRRDGKFLVRTDGPDGTPEEFEIAYTFGARPLQERNRDDEGEKILREGLSVSPKSADLHHTLGLLHTRKRRYAEAVAELGKASSLAPENPRFAYVYAVALNSTGKPEPALRVHKDAYRRNPYERDVLLGLASIVLEQGRREEAVKYGEELVALMPSSAEVKRFLERIRSKGGRLQ